MVFNLTRFSVDDLRGRFFGDGERAAEAAAFVGSLQRDEFDSFEAGQKLPRLVEGRDHPFTP